jgi:DNA-directed RNA polymerase subunit alpha
METATQYLPDLFAENLPTLDQIQIISNYVHSGEANRLAFVLTLEQNLSQSGPKATLACGIGLALIGRCKDAVEKLEKSKDCLEKFLFLARSLRAINKFDKAIAALDKCLAFGADNFKISLEKVTVWRCASNFEAARSVLEKNKNYENVSADYHYQLARILELQGLYDKAVDNYKQAIELSPNHQKALFHLAYRCDLQGDEESAIDYYKQVTSSSTSYVNALLNLTILYEDRNQYEKAADCIDKVLQYHPNHKRALLFKKDVDSSKTMIFDEEKEKNLTVRNQLLETPITDFELSVRSRNCLKKMNIKTVGDLLRISETELLSYKNFGETSLKEIKAILVAKNLKLGQASEEPAVQTPEPEQELAEENQSIQAKPVDDMQLSVRAKKCLQKLNIKTIGELTSKSEAELLGIKNFGVTSLNEIKKVLSDYGLSLRILDDTRL